MYFDPGFGGMLVQVIVAIIAVGGGILYSMRKRISKLFSKEKSNAATVCVVVKDDAGDAIDMLNDEAN